MIEDGRSRADLSCVRRSAADGRLWLGLLVSALAVVLAHLVVGLGEPGLDRAAWKVVYNGVIVAAAAACFVRARARQEERREWTLIGLGVLAWAVGNVYWTFFLVDLPEPPYPSVSDVFWLAFYPPVAVGMFGLVRARVRRFRPALVLDGLVGALAVGSVVTAAVLARVANGASGNTLGTAVNLAYPVADAVLIGIAVGAIIMSGGRPDRRLAFLAAGLVVFGASDSLYVYTVAAGTYAEGTIVDAGWPAAAVLFALAAWQPARAAAVRAPSWGPLLLPAALAAAALGVLVYAHFSAVHTASVVLAAGAVLAATARTGLTFRDYLAVLAQRTRDATTDPVTGLGNRRKLIADLDALLAGRSDGHVFALFDLDGFKDYNDTYGHPAGDALLARLGARLAAVTAHRGSAYRMGGDEFCVLVESRGDLADAVAARAAAALHEDDNGFSVSASYGAVSLPTEATASAAALRLADHRMYAQKHSSRASAYEQAINVLQSALSARNPHLGEHVTRVAEVAEKVAERVGVAAEERANIRMAAILHDIGKMGVPDAILHKPGPLDDDEWGFVRAHPAIGERILAATQALRDVARIVRSTHERWDGAGYPDGLAGADIPLGARIIFACDAFDAMTSDRPYAAAISPAEALDELRRNAGTQFDAAVVEAVCAAVAAADRCGPGLAEPLAA